MTYLIHLAEQLPVLVAYGMFMWWVGRKGGRRGNG